MEENCFSCNFFWRASAEVSNFDFTYLCTSSVHRNNIYEQNEIGGIAWSATEMGLFLPYSQRRSGSTALIIHYSVQTGASWRLMAPCHVSPRVNLWLRPTLLWTFLTRPDCALANCAIINSQALKLQRTFVFRWVYYQHSTE